MFNKKISLLVLPFMAMVSLQASDPFINDPFGDDIFKEMYQMQKEMDKVFDRMQQRMEQRSQQWNYPSRQRFITNKAKIRSSMFEDKGTFYEYNTQIPENKNNQIDINIADGVLYLKATIDTVQKSEKANVKMQQHSMRMLQRSETLPNDVDVNTLKGEYKNGIFILTLQKKKSLNHPEVKVKAPAKTPKIDNNKESKPLQPPINEKTEGKTEVKKENNTSRIRVPHSSSHV